VTLTAIGPCKESELLSVGSGSGAAQEERWGGWDTMQGKAMRVSRGLEKNL